MIIETLKPMSEIYDHIDKTKTYFPGHYHAYMGEDKVFPLPNNDGTIKAFSYKHRYNDSSTNDIASSIVFPDTQLRSLYTEEEKILMHREIERKKKIMMKK